MANGGVREEPHIVGPLKSTKDVIRADRFAKVDNLTMRTVVFQQRPSFTRTSFGNFCYATECIFYFCGLRQL